MPGILTHEQKQLAFRLRARGWRLLDIAREIGCTAPMVGLMVRDGRFTTGLPGEWEPRPDYLSIADREEILVGIRAGESLSSIARRLGSDPSTVTREVAANGGRDGYSAWHAHQRARQQAAASEAVQARAGRLVDEVSRRLEQLWSPDEIARRLPLDFPDDPEMRVSHETIYQSLFVQGRGELRRELARCLTRSPTVGPRPASSSPTRCWSRWPTRPTPGSTSPRFAVGQDARPWDRHPPEPCRFASTRSCARRSTIAPSPRKPPTRRLFAEPSAATSRRADGALHVAPVSGRRPFR